MGEGSGEAAAYRWWRSSLSCKTQLGQARGEISHGSGRRRNNKHLPMIWGWSVPYLLYILCLVVGPVSCSESCTALASAQPSLFPLHRGFLVPCKDPSPYPAQYWLVPGNGGSGRCYSHSRCIHLECVPKGVFPPTAHCAPVQPMLGLAGEQDSSFCPHPQAVTCQPPSLQLFAMSHARAGTS